MRILQVCNKPPYPPRDGGSLAMFNLVSSLCRLGHATTVLTMYSDKHKLTDERKQAFTKLMSLHAVYVNTTPRLTAMLINLFLSHKPYNALRFLSKAFKNEITRLLSVEQFDIIQLEGAYLTPYIPLIRKYSTALITLRAHNIEHEIWKRVAGTEKNLLKKLYFNILSSRIKRFEYQSINQYDLLVPITNRDMECFGRMGNVRPALVCPAGIDVDSDLAATKKNNVDIKKVTTGNPSLFFLGSLDWLPNQEGLLWFVTYVFPTMRINYPDLQFHVAGRNASDHLIKKINLHGVCFHGEITDSREFIKANDIMVAPCFSGSGMRVKVIEAMAMGKTVVTTPIGAEGLSATHNENIIIASNALEFVQYLERLFKYPDLYRKIGQDAHKFVFEKYNNMNIASALANFYKAHLK